MRLTFFLAFSVSLALSAAEKLPLSEALKLPQKSLLDTISDPVPGRKLSLVYRSAVLDASKGFKTPSTVEWRASSQDPALAALLASKIKSLGSKNGFYTLELAVLKVADAPRLSFGSRYFVIEGRVLRPDGFSVGCFITKEEGETKDGQFDFSKAVDRMIDAIPSEQFKADSPTFDNSGTKY